MHRVAKSLWGLLAFSGCVDAPQSIPQPVWTPDPPPVAQTQTATAAPLHAPETTAPPTAPDTTAPRRPTQTFTADRSCTVDSDCMPAPSCCPAPCTSDLINQRDLERARESLDCSGRTLPCISAGSCRTHAYLCVRRRCALVYEGDPGFRERQGEPRF